MHFRFKLVQLLPFGTLGVLEEVKHHLQAIHGMSTLILLLCMQTCGTMAVSETCCWLCMMHCAFSLQACTVASLEPFGSLGSRETTSPSHSWHVGIGFAFMPTDLRHHGCFGDLLLVVGNALCISASSLDSCFPFGLFEPWKK